jgi:tetratricopeptide (TPR) repeat protein
VSEDRRVDALLEQADLRMQMLDWRGAIDLLRGALAHDPDHARSHALLAMALLGAKRLPAAEIEARAALALEGDSPFTHFTMARVLTAQRKLKDAWDHCQVALQAESTDADTHVLGAWICELRGDIAKARELLREALELEASHVGALVRFAYLELDARNLGEADRYANEALRAKPADVGAHVVAGMIALVRGDDTAAEEHARSALDQESTDEDALRLWASIKAHRSWVIGLWWRFNAFVCVGGDGRRIGIQIGSFVIAQLAIILANAAGLYPLERLLQLGWLGFCAYTWFAPELWRRMLQADLGKVQLDPNY